jgi:hypothetical protein
VFFFRAAAQHVHPLAGHTVLRKVGIQAFLQGSIR